MARRKKTTDATKVIGYVRVSTDEQNIDAQKRALHAWCQSNGATLVAVFEDEGVCGATELDKRGGLLAALDALRAHNAGVLLAAKRCRLARDTVVAAMIDRLAAREGATVATADGAGNGEGPEAQLMRGMIDVFAQYERALIRTRTKAALAAKKARGERVGRIPFGYCLAEDGKTLAPKASEQAVIAAMLEMRAAGLSIRAIVAAVNTEALAARRMHKSLVARVLRREAA